jgi:hypothetical protein
MPDKEADSQTTFTISADGIDVQKIMEKIRERVEKKRAAGVYDKYNLDKVTRLEVAEAKSDEDFLRYYLKIIRKTYLLNIDDFDIPSKGGLLGKPLVWLKKIIWGMLKFYTYRMFTQQREFNLQLVHTLIALNRKMDKNHKELMQKLEQFKDASDGGKK